MITVIATVKVKEGKMDEALKILKDVVPKIRTSELGTKTYIPHTVKGKKEKNSILFYEKYVNKEALDEHMANLAKNFEKLMPLFEPGMDMKTCFEIV